MKHVSISVGTKLGRCLRDSTPKSNDFGLVSSIWAHFELKNPCEISCRTVGREELSFSDVLQIYYVWTRVAIKGGRNNCLYHHSIQKVMHNISQNNINLHLAAESALDIGTNTGFCAKFSQCSISKYCVKEGVKKRWKVRVFLLST